MNLHTIKTSLKLERRKCIIQKKKNNSRSKIQTMNRKIPTSIGGKFLTNSRLINEPLLNYRRYRSLFDTISDTRGIEKIIVVTAELTIVQKKIKIVVNQCSALIIKSCSYSMMIEK